MESISSHALIDPEHDETDDAALTHLLIWQRAVLESADCIVGDFPDGYCGFYFDTYRHLDEFSELELVCLWKWGFTLLAAAGPGSLNARGDF